MEKKKPHTDTEMDVHAHDKSALSFGQIISRIETINEKMDDPAIELEEMISLYEEGLKLIRRGREILSQADLRIQKLELSQKEEESRQEPAQADDDEFTLL